MNGISPLEETAFLPAAFAAPDSSAPWLSTHQVRAFWRTSSGSLMLASKQARRPSAAYWEFELSPLSPAVRVCLMAIEVLGRLCSRESPNSRTVLFFADLSPPEATGAGWAGGMSFSASVGRP